MADLLIDPAAQPGPLTKDRLDVVGRTLVEWGKLGGPNRGAFTSAGWLLLRLSRAPIDRAASIIDWIQLGINDRCIGQAEEDDARLDVDLAGALFDGLEGLPLEEPPRGA